MAEKEVNTASTKVNSFIEKNKNVFIILIICVVCLLAGFIIGSVIGSNAKAKDLDAVETISYNLVDGSSSLESDELTARRNDALESLKVYTKKSGIVGVRANMLAAEIAYQLEDFDAAIDYWKATVAKDKKAYTAPLANYNLGACYEEINKLDEAANAYKAAAESKDFILMNHAKFSYGRVLETQGKYADAAVVYTDLNDKSPSDTWAQLAKTRLISLKVEGKIE